jgi:hypothetical protein
MLATFAKNNFIPSEEGNFGAFTDASSIYLDSTIFACDF